ncbi:glycerophosphodiester phosphodiesterase [Aeoliella mucimassa]|uniref:Putative glycerophosphoryl diester phosphodiesterase 1 n=1 Tax=Aeoliella mucimassa TaxID=2527972 RepID=A0A518AV41_9BACT|nr:glycerophosphodiester phosphodiesterase [Aeoliella mucimassa]QDU58582.1 putative glycerophosphoryl diester phosphodiesterase 1 [Aeoliella mucimassa]
MINWRWLNVLVLVVGGMWMNTASGQWIVAHRGASYAAPENTLASFQLAWDEGADGVEGDFYLTSDGEIVCIHDKDTKRTAGKKLVVAESTLAELQQLDVGSWKDPKYAGERIPTLEQVLAIVPEGKRMVIELKIGPEIVEPLAKVLAESKVPREMITIIAFDADTVKACKQTLPDLRTHWLTSYRDQKDGTWKPTLAEVSETLAETGADGLGSQCKQAVFDAEFIQALKGQGLKEFHVWTVDDVEIARYYAKQGALGITTNRPGWLREQLQLTPAK